MGLDRGAVGTVGIGQNLGGFRQPPLPDDQRRLEGAVVSKARRSAFWRRLSGAGPPFRRHPVEAGGDCG